MSRLWVYCMTAASSIVFCTGSAEAACGDILANGIFRSVAYKDNQSFQQINYSRFLRSTYQSSKSDLALGASVPLGEAVMGKASYSESEYNQRKEQLDSTFLYKVSSSREVDLALLDGDPTIVNAWQTCMQTTGGPSIRFKAESPTEIFVTLQFHSAPNTETALKSDLTLPSGASIISGGECLKAGRALKAGDPCEALVEVPASSSWPVTIATNHGSTKGYLAPRVRLKKEYKPFPFADNCDNMGTSPSADALERCKDRNWTHAHQQTITPSYTVKISQDLIDAGWQFEISSASAPFQTISRYSPSGMSGCSEATATVQKYTFTYGYQNLAQQHGNDKSSQIYCQSSPQINMVRELWVPQS